MSPTYYKRLKERRLQRSMAGVRARERKRQAESLEGPDWERVRTMIVGIYAYKDGRHVGLWIDGRPWVVGSERAMRSKLAKLMYRRAAPDGDHAHSPDCAIALNGRHGCSCGADKVGGKEGKRA